MMLTSPLRCSARASRTDSCKQCVEALSMQALEVPRCAVYLLLGAALEHVPEAEQDRKDWLGVYAVCSLE